MKASILVPSSLNEVTLKQYQKFVRLDQDVDLSTPFYMQKLVEIFCGIDLRDVANIRYKSLVDTVEHIQGLFKSKSKFINRFTMHGVEYGFIPVLDDISLGEYVDLDNYLSDPNNMHKAMAVLYRPITHSKDDRYDIEPYKGTDKANDFLDMPLDVALGAYVFFYHLNKELVSVTMNCLEMEEVDSELKQILEENGGGIKAYMHSLKEILQDLDISQR
tara:strand:- start:17023 stop:17676 length:654 start_codon:yes stop_codon:yes gene_type:complete